MDIIVVLASVSSHNPGCYFRTIPHGDGLGFQAVWPCLLDHRGFCNHGNFCLCCSGYGRRLTAENATTLQVACRLELKQNDDVAECMAVANHDRRRDEATLFRRTSEFKDRISLLSLTE